MAVRLQRQPVMGHSAAQMSAGLDDPEVAATPTQLPRPADKAFCAVVEVNGAPPVLDMDPMLPANRHFDLRNFDLTSPLVMRWVLAAVFVVAFALSATPTIAGAFLRQFSAILFP